MKFTGNLKTIPVLIVLVAILLTNTLVPTQQVQAQEGFYQVYFPLILQGNQTSPQVCLPGDLQWLCLLNQYRTAAGLNTVANFPDYSAALALHTNYLLLNPGQTDFHEEYPYNPGYTEEGEIAGSQSNMAWKASTDFQVQETMELWMKFSSHRYNMLHPDLEFSGFDLSCDTSNCASGLNVLGSLPLSYEVTEQNVYYPGDNQTGIPADIFPVTWGVYMPWTGHEDDSDEVYLISADIFNQQNQKISITTTEPNHTDGVWNYKNQVVLTPNQSLLSNQTYRVEMTVSFHGQTFQHTWSFSTR